MKRRLVAAGLLAVLAIVGLAGAASASDSGWNGTMPKISAHL